MGRHTWRLVADDENFDVAEALSEIVELTESEPIDHWFEAGKSIFMGRGEPPQHEYIGAAGCTRCAGHSADTDAPRCYWCLGLGVVLEWTAPTEHQVREAINGLRALITELEKPFNAEHPVTAIPAGLSRHRG